MSPLPEISPLVVVVDDDESIRRALERLLRSGGLATVTFASGEALLQALDALEPACAVIDLHLPGIDGLQVQQELFERKPEVPVVIITGYDEPESERRALAAGAAGYLLKPFSQPDLLGTVLAATKLCGEPHTGSTEDS